jgi:subfamily B ATP-binding cassette protein MsbA
LADINGQLQRGLAAAESVFHLLDQPEELNRGRISRSHPVLGRIEFCDVNLVYNTRSEPALKNVSLAIGAGQHVALVGPSGGGKTSLINLIPRLYDPSKGSVKIDGTDVRDFELGYLRSQIALVSQDVTLFSDTILNNIIYGARQASTETIEQALRVTGLKDFVTSLPDGLDTVVGDRGVQLSGGQRQRIAMARAILKSPAILILDEATAALDTLSENLIKNSIELMRKDITTISVAHRLATIEKTDYIFVVNNGELSEHGTHQQLIQQQGLYQTLWAQNRQTV